MKLASVNKMDGAITLSSQVGVGTSAVVVLRYSIPSPCRQIPLHTKLSSFINHKIKAMIVEDIPFNAKINKEFLLKCNADVRYIAPNGAKAVEYYQNEILAGRRIDLICMDIEIPEMDGKRAAQLIRAFETSHKKKPCQIIFTSGNCLGKEISECLDHKGEIRGNYFLRKPVMFNQFSHVYSRVQASLFC